MNYEGIDYVVRARPGRDQWVLLIYFSDNATVVKFNGTRDEASAAARRRDRQLGEAAAATAASQFIAGLTLLRKFRTAPRTSSPILFGLTLHGRRCWIFELSPVGRSARSVADRAASRRSLRGRACKRGGRRCRRPAVAVTRQWPSSDEPRETTDLRLSRSSLAMMSLALCFLQAVRAAASSGLANP